MTTDVTGSPAASDAVDFTELARQLPGALKNSDGSWFAECPVCEGREALYAKPREVTCIAGCSPPDTIANALKRAVSPTRPPIITTADAQPELSRFPRLSRSAFNSGEGAAGEIKTTYAEAGWPCPPAPAAYHGLLGKIVALLEPHTESDPVAIAGQFLAFFGNVIGRNTFFRVESDRHYTNMNVCLVGATAKGRKGTSAGYVKRIFGEVDPFWLEGQVKSGLSSGEGLIHAVRDDGPSQEKRLLALEPEFASVLKVAEREGNTISPRIRDAWDTGNLYTLTKADPLKATGAHISIIGHITADELRRYLRQTETANGFANRFLWLCVRRSKLLPDGGNLEDSELAPLIEELRDAVAFAGTVEQVCRDNEARILWHEVYEELSADVPGLVGAITSRAEAQVTRLSLLYALLDQSAVIRQEHLSAALAFWKYADASARYIFGDSIGDPVADEVLHALRAVGDSGLTRNELRDHFSGNQRSNRIGDVLAALERQGLARVEKISTTEGGRGRKAEIWYALNALRD